MQMSQKHSRKWFAARLIFKSQVGTGLEIDPLCEDRVVLFFADNEDRAREAALAYGRKEGISYQNEAGDEVRWRFVSLEDIDEVGTEPLPNGWEVSARHFRPSDNVQAKSTEDRMSKG